MNRHKRRQCWCFCFTPPGPGDATLIFPEAHPFKKEVVVNIMLSRQGGNATIFLKGFKRHANEPELKFGRIALACKRFRVSHQVST